MDLNEKDRFYQVLKNIDISGNDNNLIMAAMADWPSADAETRLTLRYRYHDRPNVLKAFNVLPAELDQETTYYYDITEKGNIDATFVIRLLNYYIRPIVPSLSLLAKTEFLIAPISLSPKEPQNNFIPNGRPEWIQLEYSPDTNYLGVGQVGVNSLENNTGFVVARANSGATIYLTRYGTDPAIGASLVLAGRYQCPTRWGPWPS